MSIPENAEQSTTDEITDTTFPLVVVDDDPAPVSLTETGIADQVLTETGSAEGAALTADDDTVAGLPAQTESSTSAITPPSPDHSAFLKSLSAGEFGFDLMVYADRVEEDGQLEAAHVLRHHDGFFTYRKNALALHRAICAQIERIFGCRYAPSTSLFHSPELRIISASHRLYIRKTSFLGFEHWPPPEGRTAFWDLYQHLGQFERRIIDIDATKTRHLIRGRGSSRQYEIATLPFLFAYLAGAPSRPQRIDRQTVTQGD
jgi:hypothetical protein